MSLENFVAWRQDNGHDYFMTTFNTYNSVATKRQGGIIDDLFKPKEIE